MKKYPMLLKPVPRQMIWGGNKLKDLYNKKADFDNIGESWELTIRPEAQSVIENGIYKGRYLHEILDCGNNFPLLIKFIDAHDKLSVQVHPDDDITDENGVPLGKTEMWYIIDADEDAHIIYGLSDGTDLSDLQTMILNNEFDKGLEIVYVKPGDCYFIPAGQIHAIGKGIVLAEIQQNSDTTYRLYDYGRLDKDGNPRELHVESALKVIKNRTKEEIDKLRFTGNHSNNCLADCEKFSAYKFTSNIDHPIHFDSSSSFSALVFTEGDGEITCNGESYSVRSGDTYFIPDGINFDIIGTTTFLQAKAKG